MTSKGARDENFPVASFLLPKWSRPHVMAFYAFARAADDIADSARLGRDEKRRQLCAMALQIKADGTVSPDQTSDVVCALNHSLQETGVSPQHALNVLDAFLWDVDHPTTPDWKALMAYCQLSAAPVGRYLIDLFGGIDGGYGPSDALCAALQVLNHIQDMKDDVTRLKRIYVPSDWMGAYGVVPEDLCADQASEPLRRVLSQMLDGVDTLLIEAKPMTRCIRSRALAREAGGIIRIAEVLARKLRTADPMATRVELSVLQMAAAFGIGAFRA